MKQPLTIATSIAAATLMVLALASTSEAGRSLTIQQARDLALENNRTYLSAKEGVTIASADVTKARSAAFPNVSLSGSYDYNFDVPSFFIHGEDSLGSPETSELKIGSKNSFGANLSITQSIWSGGKVFTAMSIANDYRSFSEDAAGSVAANVVYQADLHFYLVALQQSEVEVFTKSLEAAEQNLTVVETQFSQGQVSEFDVLRARVEKSNLEPQLLRAESNLRLATKRLNSLLGLDLGEEINLIEVPIDLEQDAAPADLSDLTRTALERRPEMRQAAYMSKMRHKAIRIARAGYYPSLSAVANYNWQAQSDRMTLNENTNSTWTAGLRVTIPIFQGGQVRGAVTTAISEHTQAILDEHQKRDDIKLQVEDAYDRLKQSRKALLSQTNNIAQAEEGLRIANLRNESGVGILLEVLSAQAALTQARQLLAEATFAYRTARAGLKKATTIDLDELQ
jgi:outer membrane protein TolC